jgi:hypothetical protein
MAARAAFPAPNDDEGASVTHDRSERFELLWLEEADVSRKESIETVVEVRGD